MLCDPEYRASIGSPLFDFDPEWWEDIVGHSRAQKHSTTPMMTEAQETAWTPPSKIPDAPPVRIAADDHPMATGPWSYDTSSAVQIIRNQGTSWPFSAEAAHADWPMYRPQEPGSLDSSPSMSYSSSALLSPISPASRGSKRPPCADETSPAQCTLPSTKRRRLSHCAGRSNLASIAVPVFSTSLPKQRRFFIGDEDADDESAGSGLQQEAAWEIVQGAWWDGTKLAMNWEWESTMSQAALPRYHVQAEGDGPQNAPVICVKAMPLLREPVPTLPARTVDSVIEALEQSASRPGLV
jgi:hypothetical protein